MKKTLAAITALMLLVCAASLAEVPVDTLTYAVFPYLPDAGYYQELIEQRWPWRSISPTWQTCLRSSS